MDKELSAFVNLVVQAAVPVLVTFVIGLFANKVLPTLADLWKSSVDEKTQAFIEDTIVLVVRAAEEAGLVAKLKGEAFDKLEYAVDMAGTFLAQYGIDLDEAQIVALIRAVLSRSNSFDKLMTGDASDASGEAKRAAPSIEELLEKHWA